MYSSRNDPRAMAKRSVCCWLVLIGGLALAAQADEKLERFMVLAEGVAEELGFEVDRSRADEGLLALRLGTGEQLAFVPYHFFAAGEAVGYAERIIIVGGGGIFNKPAAEAHVRFWKEIKRAARGKGIRLKKLGKKDLGEEYYVDPVLEDYMRELRSQLPGAESFLRDR